MSSQIQPRMSLQERLFTEPTVWLSSLRPDNRPHVVPVWFTWDGACFDLFSKPTAQKVRNVREHPDVMLGLGEPDEEFDVELVEGTASVLAHPTAEVVPSAMFEKYAARMARLELDRQTFVTTYSQPIRITPTRFLGYGGRGWSEPAPAVDDDQDVSGHMSLVGGHFEVSNPRHLLATAIRRVAGELRSLPDDLAALQE